LSSESVHKSLNAPTHKQIFESDFVKLEDIDLML